MFHKKISYTLEKLLVHCLSFFQNSHRHRLLLYKRFCNTIEMFCIRPSCTFVNSISWFLVFRGFLSCLRKLATGLFHCSLKLFCVSYSSISEPQSSSLSRVSGAPLELTELLVSTLSKFNFVCFGRVHFLANSRKLISPNLFAQQWYQTNISWISNLEFFFTFCLCLLYPFFKVPNILAAIPKITFSNVNS